MTAVYMYWLTHYSPRSLRLEIHPADLLGEETQQHVPFPLSGIFYVISTLNNLFGSFQRLSHDSTCARPLLKLSEEARYNLL